MRRAVVEDHRDVRAEFALDIHGFFWSKKEKRSVQMRPELDSVRLDFANGCEAEDLETAAIGKDGPIPIYEVVEAASSSDDFHARTDVQMIGVAEDDLGAHFAQFARIDGFDAALGADRHEDRGVDRAVRSGQTAEAGAGGGIGFEEFEHW